MNTRPRDNRDSVKNGSAPKTSQSKAASRAGRPERTDNRKLFSEKYNSDAIENRALYAKFLLGDARKAAPFFWKEWNNGTQKVVASFHLHHATAITD